MTLGWCPFSTFCSPGTLYNHESIIPNFCFWCPPEPSSTHSRPSPTHSLNPTFRTRGCQRSSPPQPQTLRLIFASISTKNVQFWRPSKPSSTHSKASSTHSHLHRHTDQAARAGRGAVSAHGGRCALDAYRVLQPPGLYCQPTGLYCGFFFRVRGLRFEV